MIGFICCDQSCQISNRIAQSLTQAKTAITTMTLPELSVASPRILFVTALLFASYLANHFDDGEVRQILAAMDVKQAEIETARRLVDNVSLASFLATSAQAMTDKQKESTLLNMADLLFQHPTPHANTTAILELFVTALGLRPEIMHPHWLTMHIKYRNFSSSMA